MAEVTQSELRKVAKETRKKLERETAVLPAIKTVFNRMARDASALYASNGRLLDAAQYTNIWEVLLDRHYRLTGNEFIGEAFDIERSRLFSSVLSAAYTDYAKLQSLRQAGFITHTNQIDINKAFTLAEIQVARDGTLVPSKELISRIGKRNLKASFDVRAPIIAQTETQTAAEHMKYLEARAVGGERLIVDQPQIVEKPIRSFKKWVTVIDGKQRATHLAANGQEVLRDEAFVVGGERLRYPADPKLGASIGNIVNCRCNALFFTEEL